MSEQRRRPARLEIGQEVVRTPETIFEEAHGKAVRRPMRGRVDYIHPRGAVPYRGFQGARQNHQRNLSRCGGIDHGQKSGVYENLDRAGSA